MKIRVVLGEMVIESKVLQSRFVECIVFFVIVAVRSDEMQWYWYAFLMSLLVEVIAGTDSFVAFGTSLSGSNRAAGWPQADVTGRQFILVSGSHDTAKQE